LSVSLVWPVLPVRPSVHVRSRANGAHTCSARTCAYMYTHVQVPYACPSRTATAHREGVCVCSPPTRPAPTLCTPKGSARRSLRRTAEVEQRDARQDDSRWAHHARYAAPDRPVVQPPLSVRTCVWLLARLRTHFLGVTGSSGTLLPRQTQQTLQFKRSSVRPRLCAHLALLYRRCRQCASAAVPLCTASGRAPIRGNPSLPLRSLAGGRRGAQNSLSWLIGQLSAGPRAPRPHATTHGRCRGVS
jgi:hypothetical protein